MKRRAMWTLVVVYAVAAVASLTQIVLSGNLSTVQTDPLSSVVALLLALPWSILLMFFGKVTGLASVIVLGVGMGLNLALLAGIARGAAGRAGKPASTPGVHHADTD